MPADYPTSVKAFVAKTDGVDDVRASHVNDIHLEVEALETNHIPTYGHMYMHNGSQVVVVAVVDTYYEVPGGMTVGANLKDVTFSLAKQLTVGRAGKYLVTWSLSAQGAVANQEIEGLFMINGVAEPSSSAHAEATGGGKPHVLAGSSIVNLALNAIIKFAVANHTGANNIEISHANLTITRIGS